MNIKDGKLVIDLEELVESLSPDAQMEVIKHLCCESTVIERIGQQIAQGMTDDGWHGSAEDEVRAMITESMDWITESVHDDYKRKIERLREQCESYRIQLQDKNNKECYLGHYR